MGSDLHGLLERESVRETAENYRVLKQGLCKLFGVDRHTEDKKLLAMVSIQNTEHNDLYNGFRNLAKEAQTITTVSKQLITKYCPEALEKVKVPFQDYEADDLQVGDKIKDKYGKRASRPAMA